MKTSTCSLSFFAGSLLVLLTLAGPLAIRSAAFSQYGGDADRQELREFGEFLSNHPWIANKLWEKPRRANDKDFLDDNPELRYWLQDHPRPREEFRENARAFMDRERDFERHSLNEGDRRWDPDVTRGELASFDRFLDDHPKIARDLRQEPSLINSGEYLEHHEELREFLRNHPAVREELRGNPRAFMYQDRRYERVEDSR